MITANIEQYDELLNYIKDACMKEIQKQGNKILEEFIVEFRRRAALKIDEIAVDVLYSMSYDRVGPEIHIIVQHERMKK